MVNKKVQQEKVPALPAEVEEEEEEEFDPVAFQASLDQSVNAAKLLVNSWIPSDFGGPASASTSVQSLKDKARPPRMGLGAQPAAIHKQQAEDRKLKERLLGKGRNGSFGDEGSTVKPTESNKREDGAGEGPSESESDEEDSRSRVISKGKGKAKSAGTDSNALPSGTKHAPNNPFVTRSKEPTSTPRKSDTAPPLFNDPSPSKPSPAKPAASPTPADSTKPPASSTSTRSIAPVSFYSEKNTNFAAGEGGGGLSKNQRKKLRKQEREQENKKRLVEESRAEEEMERTKGTKRAREGEDDVDVKDGAAEGDVEMSEAQAGTISESSKVSTVVGAGGTDGAESRKKKKKRKGKGKGGESTEPPLLNL